MRLASEPGRDKNMKYIISIILALWTITAFGTEVDRKPISEITKEADHVFIGKITKIDYKDENGKILDEGGTGPGCDAEIRAHIQVDQTQILKTSSLKIPDSLVVPYWNKFHYSADMMKILEGKSYVFCLKGENYERVYPAHWHYDLSYKEDIQMSIDGMPSQAELTGTLRTTILEDNHWTRFQTYILEVDGQKQMVELKGEIAAESLWDMDGNRIWVKGHLLTQQKKEKSLGLFNKKQWGYFMVVREIKEITNEFEIPLKEKEAEPIK